MAGEIRARVRKGQRIGKLVVKKVVLAEWGSHRRTMVECRCDCGKKHVVEQKKLVIWHTQSCGCSHHRRKDRSRTAEYRAWYFMMRRCYAKKDKAYKDYGGRGIRVCKRWHDFDSFAADMGKKPSSRHSLGRKDNDGDYSPDNCEWQTKLQQANNTRNSLLLTARGKTMTLAQWVGHDKKEYNRVQARLYAGWPVEKALFKPRRGE
jgi:hypothetical protein